MMSKNTITRESTFAIPLSTISSSYFEWSEKDPKGFPKWPGITRDISPIRPGSYNPPYDNLIGIDSRGCQGKKDANHKTDRFFWSLELSA
jgi:hypothetical protein